MNTETVEQTRSETAPAMVQVKMDDVIALVARLARLLAKEVELLKVMKVGEIEALQQEKMKVVDALENVQRTIRRHPELLEQFDDQEREDLRSVIGIFEQILLENHSRLLVARDINGKVVEVIRDAIAEQTGMPRYGEHGEKDHRVPGAEPTAIKMNEVI